MENITLKIMELQVLDNLRLSWTIIDWIHVQNRAQERGLCVSYWIQRHSWLRKWNPVWFWRSLHGLPMWLQVRKLLRRLLLHLHSRLQQSHSQCQILLEWRSVCLQWYKFWKKCFWKQSDVWKWWNCHQSSLRKFEAKTILKWFFFIFSIFRDVTTYQRTTSFIGKEVPTILRNISLEVVKRVHLKILRPTLDHTTFSWWMMLKISLLVANGIAIMMSLQTLTITFTGVKRYTS